MFDFTPVGIGLALAGVIFLAFGWRLLPGDRKGAAAMEAAFNLEGYTTEVAIPEDSPLAGKTVRDLERLGEDEVEVVAILHGRNRIREPHRNTKLQRRPTPDPAGRAGGAGARGRRGQAHAHPRREGTGDRRARRRYRGDGGDRDRRIAPDRQLRRSSSGCTTATTSTCWRSAAAGGASCTGWARSASSRAT